MSAPPRMTREEIEAHAQDVQSKKKATVDVPDSERIGLGESGKFDTDIYGSKNKYEGYYDSIAPNEDIEDDDFDSSNTQGGRPRANYTAPLSVLNDIPQAEKDHDPFAEHRTKTVAERQSHNEYFRKQPKLVMSPERVDFFADDLQMV